VQLTRIHHTLHVINNREEKVQRERDDRKYQPSSLPVPFVKQGSMAFCSFLFPRRFIDKREQEREKSKMSFFFFFFFSRQCLSNIFAVALVVVAVVVVVIIAITALVSIR
jgi:hypothetical protein